MSMRTLSLTTHLQPEDAYTLIEFLDQLRDALMHSHGDDITAMLRQASTRQGPTAPRDDDPFV